MIRSWRNWNRKTELASRIAALIPSETGADLFTAFGWKVLNDIVNGLIATDPPNLVRLRRYIEGGPDDLCSRHCVSTSSITFRTGSRGSAALSSSTGNQFWPTIGFYKEIVIHDAQSVDLDGLISTYEHNREHFQKMVASPISDSVDADQRSTDRSCFPNLEPGHERVVTDMARAIRTEKVLYVGLDSLADATVGSAIGSVLLADLTAVAGDRYNYGIHSIKPRTFSSTKRPRSSTSRRSS